MIMLSKKKPDRGHLSPAGLFAFLERKRSMLINVLGTTYGIHERSAAEDALLEEFDGYCDKTTKLIVIAKQEEDCELGSYEAYRKKVLRHEIIHAFLFESGLHECWKHEDGHDETYVDWIAVQFPKLLEAFVEAGCM